MQLFLSYSRHVFNIFHVFCFSIEKRKSEKRAEIISGPVLLEQYIALADFKKTGRGQISLVAGDIVDVIEKNENGTWAC